METVIEALKKVAIFGDFPEDALQKLNQNIENLSLPADTILFTQGDEGKEMYMILHGQVSIYGVDEQGHEVLFDELNPGEYFGEISLLDNKPRSASARTISKCELVKLRQEDFLNVLNLYPALALKLVNDFSSRLRENVKILEQVQGDHQQPKVVDPQREHRVRVFVSYSRRDKDFVLKLHDGLVKNGFETWVDWEGIPLGTDWWQEIVEGIQGCDNFLFVISPDSVASKVCADEIQTAIDSNKRLVPVVIREEQGMVSLIRAELQAINFTFMRSDEELQKMFPSLVATLSTDVQHLKAHTRLQNLALEWDRKKRTSSLTLRGEELENAESWLAHASGKQPNPSELQGDFIQASRKDANRRQRQFLTGVITALVISVVLAVVAAFSYVQADQSRKEAIVSRQLAETAQVEAQNNEAFAKVQQATAEAASIEALNQQAIALREAEAASKAEAKALEQKGLADQQRTIAEEQREIADAQRLASQAEGDLNKGNLLTRSILLAIASMHKARNFQADLALRVGLDILPTLINREKLKDETFESQIVKVVYSSDSKWLAIAEANGHITIWDSAYATTTNMSHDAAVTDIIFSPDGTKLFSTSEDGTARIWDPATGEELFRLQHDGPVRALAISPNGYWLATGGDDQYARTWNARTGKQIASVFHTGAVTDVDFSPGGSWVASVGKDKAAIVWTPTTGVEILTIYHDTEVNLVLFGPGAIWMATASQGGTVTIWNPRNGARIAVFSHEQDVVSMAFSPDGRLLATGSLDQTARIWEPQTGRALSQLRHDRQVTAVAFSSNGQWVATASEDHTARVWEPLTGREIALMEHADGVNTVAFTPNGLILVTGSQDNFVRVWSPEAVGQAIVSLKHPDRVIDLDFSPDETLLATAGGDKTLRVWQVGPPPTLLLTIPAGSNIIDVDYSKDGRFIATGTQDGIARIWDASTGVELKTFPHEGAVSEVDFSRDGTWLITGSKDGTARIWGIETGELLHTFQHGGEVGEVSLNAEGDILATASLDNSARIWDIATNTEILHLEHPAGVTLVSFISATNWVVTVSQDNAVRFWDDTTGELLDRFFVDSQIRAIEISADGSKLAVTGEDSIARVWEIVADGDNISLTEVSRVVHLDIINDVVFGDNGHMIATASDDGTVLLSLLIPDELIEKACSRLTRNLTQLEWGQFFEGEIYELTCPNSPPDPLAIDALKTEVGRLGAEGDYVSAVDLMRHIIELAPSLEIDIAEEIRRLTIETILTNGIIIAQEGVFEEAYALYEQANSFKGVEAYPRYADFLVNLCMIGGTETTAERILPICHTAIDSTPDNRLLFEGRVRAWAWTDQFENAIEDLNEAIALLENEALSEEQRSFLTAERLEWLNKLEAGENPFIEAPPN